MKDPAWAWKVLKHLLRDLRKPSWIVAHFAKKDRHISLEYVRHCRQKWEKYGDPAYKQRRVRRGALIWQHRQWIVQRFEEDPALFFDELQPRRPDRGGCRRAAGPWVEAGGGSHKCPPSLPAVRRAPTRSRDAR